MSDFHIMKGYVIACCELVNMHDMPEVAADLLMDMGITESEIKMMGLDEVDLDHLREIRAARGRDPIEASP